MTSAAPEPTDEQRWAAEGVAAELCEVLDDMSGLYPAGVDAIARALAAAVAAEREKYQRVADEWWSVAGRVPANAPLGDEAYAQTLYDCAREIREVSQ